MGLFNLFQKKSVVSEKSDSRPTLYPLPRSSSVITTDLFSLKFDDALPKYTYTDVPVCRLSADFNHLMPYTILYPIYVDPDGKVVIVYFDINDKDVIIGTLENAKLVKMIRDWSERNWTCFGQVSPSGDEINLAFWDCE